MFKACQELATKYFSLYLDSLELMLCIVQHALKSMNLEVKGAQTIWAKYEDSQNDVLALGVEWFYVSQQTSKWLAHSIDVHTT